MCKNGDCVQSLSDCKYSLCPVNLPYRCYDQSCAQSKELCETNDNLCEEPYPYIFTCNDQSIVCCPYNISCCPVNLCENNEVLCDDGTCSKNKDLCKNQAGCPASLPNRCVDGTCVHDPYYCNHYNECPINYTSCNDKMCVSSSLNCPINNFPSSLCPSNKPFLCADGTCTTTFDAVYIIIYSVKLLHLVLMDIIDVIIIDV